MTGPGIPAIGVLLHVYYPDLLPGLVAYLRHFPPSTTLLVSTPPEHLDSVEATLRKAMPSASIDCRGVPNAGRDIGPMLVAFSAALLKLDLVCKLHGKKSPHHGNRGTWREFLVHNLAGSAAVVKDTIAIFEADPGLGAVFPSNGIALKAWMGWGEETLLAVRPVCESIGIDPLSVPDFPAGSMYWFRPRALEGLLERRWSWREFQVEAGGAADATLAHGIERIILAMVHRQGFTWRKVNTAGGPRRAPGSFSDAPGHGIAVVVHVWRTEGIMTIIAGLKNLAFDFDLLVSVSSDVEPGVSELLRQHFPGHRVRVFRVPNAGHDIGPFVALGRHIMNYSLACKLHIKTRSPEWFEYLLDNLVGGIAEVNTILALFQRDPELGIVYPATFPPARAHLAWGSNFENARALTSRLGVPPPDPRVVKFAAGAMFWFRPACLEGLLQTGVQLNFDEEDNGRADGALSHAVERLFLHIGEAAGYRVREVLFHPYRGRPDLALYPRRAPGFSAGD